MRSEAGLENPDKKRTVSQIWSVNFLSGLTFRVRKYWRRTEKKETERGRENNKSHAPKEKKGKGKYYQAKCMASEKALLESEISRVRDIRHMRREKEMLEKKIREKREKKERKKLKKESHWSTQLPKAWMQPPATKPKESKDTVTNPKYV